MSKILSIDVSGNFKEGKGTSGICRIQDKVIQLEEMKASHYETAEEYWQSHVDLIQKEWPDHLVLEGYKLYNNKKTKANMQTNSELETPQLIGIIKLTCYQLEIPLTVQFASEVKTRWSDKVLQNLGYLDENNKFKGQRTSTHKRDALRHALHYWRYKHVKNG